jgi:hypothetical protein
VNWFKGRNHRKIAAIGSSGSNGGATNNDTRDYSTGAIRMTKVRPNQIEIEHLNIRCEYEQGDPMWAEVTLIAYQGFHRWLVWNVDHTEQRVVHADELSKPSLFPATQAECDHLAGVSKEYGMSWARTD